MGGWNSAVDRVLDGTKEKKAFLSGCTCTTKGSRLQSQGLQESLVQVPNVNETKERLGHSLLASSYPFSRVAFLYFFQNLLAQIKLHSP